MKCVVPQVIVMGDQGSWCIDVRPVWSAITNMFDSENDQKRWMESMLTNSLWNLLGDMQKKNIGPQQAHPANTAIHSCHRPHHP